MAQLAVVLLALFAQMERTYAIERAAHARAEGRRTGRPVSVDAEAPGIWAKPVTKSEQVATESREVQS